MVTMTVPVEVEATPELVEQHLRAYAASVGSAGAFPVASGTMVDLQPPVIKAIGALDGAKALIVEASQKSPHALIAFVKAAGGFGIFWGMASQVIPPAAPAAAAAPAPAPAEQPPA